MSINGVYLSSHNNDAISNIVKVNDENEMIKWPGTFKTPLDKLFSLLNWDAFENFKENC